jgi:transcriptional regulator GlxA family with amidase domain
VSCLVNPATRYRRLVSPNHMKVMHRFEHLLAAHSDRPIRVSEVCDTLGVPERTLRVCCASLLGMGPSQDDRLGRLNLVRKALRQQPPEIAQVAEIAKRYGFSEAGRFAGHYRSIFGEYPSLTLRRSAQLSSGTQ